MREEPRVVYIEKEVHHNHYHEVKNPINMQMANELSEFRSERARQAQRKAHIEAIKRGEKTYQSLSGETPTNYKEFTHDLKIISSMGVEGKRRVRMPYFKELVNQSLRLNGKNQIKVMTSLNHELAEEEVYEVSGNVLMTFTEKGEVYAVEFKVELGLYFEIGDRMSYVTIGHLMSGKKRVAHYSENFRNQKQVGTKLFRSMMSDEFELTPLVKTLV